MNLGELGERVRRATVAVHAGGQGSGLIWDPAGVVVTNAHVAQSTAAEVELWDGRRVRATVTARDPRRDLAALSIQATGLAHLPAGDSTQLRAGELVVAVGNPLGFTGALTSGVIHGVGPVRGLGRRDWVQADVRLAPGNSGGPLANARGEAVGLNTMILGLPRRALALAVPARDIARFLTGERGASLGVTLRPVAGGLLVLEILPGGPAERASLLPGDLLLCTLRGLGELLDARPGSLALPFRRAARDRRVTVVFEPRSAAA